MAFPLSGLVRTGNPGLWHWDYRLLPDSARVPTVLPPQPFSLANFPPLKPLPVSVARPNSNLLLPIPDSTPSGRYLLRERNSLPWASTSAPSAGDRLDTVNTRQSPLSCASRPQPGVFPGQLTQRRRQSTRLEALPNRLIHRSICPRYGIFSQHYRSSLAIYQTKFDCFQFSHSICLGSTGGPETIRGRLQHPSAYFNSTNRHHGRSSHRWLAKAWRDPRESD